MFHQEILSDIQAEHRYYESIHEEQTKCHIASQMDSKPLEKFMCRCSLCYMQSIRPFPKANSGQDPLCGTNQRNRDSDYVFLIKRLHPPQGKTRCLRIMIPETTIFNERGEVEVTLTCTREDRRQPNYTFHVLRQKLNFNGLRKYFVERRKIYQKTLNQFHMKVEGSSMNTPRKDSSNFQGTLSLGQALVTINTRFIMKKSREESQEDNFERSIQESILLKYLDGSVQILSEAEISNLLMQRRRIDWSQIIYAQQYYKPERGYRLLNVNFLHARDSYHSLFQQAENEIMSINNEISKASEDFIPTEREEEYEIKLARTDEPLLLKYLSFKIFHYLNKFSNIHIVQASLDFLKDDMDQYMLISASKVLYKPSLYTNKLEEYDTSLPQMPEEEDRTNILQQDRRIAELTNELKTNYNQWKQDMGVNKSFSLPYDHESDIVFRKLYPKSQVTDFTINHGKRRHLEMVDSAIVHRGQPKTKSKSFQRRHYESMASEFTNTRFLSSQPYTSLTNNTIIQKQLTQPQLEETQASLMLADGYRRPKTGIGIGIGNKLPSNGGIKHSSKSVGRQSYHYRKGNLSSLMERKTIKNGTLPFFLYKNLNFESGGSGVKAQ